MVSFKFTPDEKLLNLKRPLPFYFITTTDPKELSFEVAYTALERVKEEGFGGIVLFNKPPYGFNGEQYLSQAWFDMVRNFSAAALALDLILWINDGFDFPPGDAGGRISPEKYPDLTQKKLALKEDRVVIEEVDWGFPAFEEPQSAELFHKFVYEKYLQEVGEYFGKPIKGFFSDADNRRVSYKVFWENSPQKDYFPWSNNFAESFSKHYGYDVSPYLVEILKNSDCPQKADYWEHAGRLYQSWFASNYKWCREHGLEYTFHTSDTSTFTWEEAPRSSLYTEGRALDMESNCDYSGTDQELLELNGGKHMKKDEYWMPRVSWGGDNALVRNPEYRKLYGDLRAKQASSSAFLHNKKGAMCEMFAASNWGASPTELREIAAWQIMQGITFIVPHAYHHKFKGNTKYFAPPIFSPYSTLSKSSKLLNDELALYCYYTTLGSLKAPIALLDITDDIWSGRSDGTAYMKAAEELNRMPYGYVLADAKSIAKNRDKFSVIINAGAELEGGRKELVESLSIPIITPSEMGNLEEYVENTVSYKGEGTPHFMRRALEDGSELVIIANIENESTIKGVLSIGSNSFDVAIETGELLFFTKDGQISKKTHYTCPEACVELPKEADVVWAEPNILPIERWSDAEGNPVCKHTADGQLYFEYEVKAEQLSALKLMVSKLCYDNILNICIDGTELTEYTEDMVFDDDYICFDFALGSTKGQHVLSVVTKNPLPDYDRIFIKGEFGVSVVTEDPYNLYGSYQYSLDKFVPKTAKVTLYERETTLLTDKSWCEQGHIFYSGAATYKFKLTLPDDFGKAALKLNAVNDMCEVAVDGKFIGKMAFEPFTLLLKNMSGKHTLNITVYNSMANAMEFYAEPSGLTAGGCVFSVKD